MSQSASRKYAGVPAETGAMTGTASQVEWATLIKPRVNDEFDRVANALESVFRRQDAAAKRETRAIIAILEEKRTEVMAIERAGYFIREWQELNGRVRQMIAEDSRYQTILAGRQIRSKTQRNEGRS